MFTNNSLAAAIGPGVIRLRVAELLEEEQIPSMFRCPHLIEFALSLREAGNSEMLKLCWSLKSLRSLRVGYEWDGSNAFNPRMKKWMLGVPLVWTAGIYPRIAHNVPTLSHLALLNAGVPFAQLEEILKTTGQRLKTLVLSVFDQDVSRTDYCERLLYAVWEFNPKLRLLMAINYHTSTHQINY